MDSKYCAGIKFHWVGIERVLRLGSSVMTMPNSFYSYLLDFGFV